MFAFGFGACMLYDLLRIIRIAIPHNHIAVSVEDVFYWLLCTVPAVFSVQTIATGVIRIYMIVGFLGGLLVCRRTISRFFVPFCGKITKKALKKLINAVKIRICTMARGGRIAKR